MHYRFGAIRLDLESGICVGPRGEIRLRRKTFALLSTFVRNPGRILSKDQLLDRVWGTRHLHQDSLSQAVSELRKALGDDPRQPRFIETVHSRGYRFIATVEACAPEEIGGIGEAGEAAPRHTLRPRMIGALVVLFALFVGWLAWRAIAPVDAPSSVPERPPTIALLDLVDIGLGDLGHGELGAGEPSWLTVGLPELLGRRLRQAGAYVYPRRRLQALAADRATEFPDDDPIWPGDLESLAGAVPWIHRYLDAEAVIAGTLYRSKTGRSTIRLAVFDGALSDGARGVATWTRTLQTTDADLSWRLARLGDEIRQHLGLGGRARNARGARPIPPLEAASRYFTALRILPADPQRALALLDSAAAEHGEVARIAAAKRDAWLQLGDRSRAIESARLTRNLSKSRQEEIRFDLLTGRVRRAVSGLHDLERTTGLWDPELGLEVLEGLVEAGEARMALAELDRLRERFEGMRADGAWHGAWQRAALDLIEAQAAARVRDPARRRLAARRAAETARARGQHAIATRAEGLGNAKPRNGE